MAGLKYPGLAKKKGPTKAKVFTKTEIFSVLINKLELYGTNGGLILPIYIQYSLLSRNI